MRYTHKFSFFRAKATAAAAALLIFFCAAVSSARDTGFDILAERKGPPAVRLLEDPTLYKEAAIKDLPCGADDFDFLLDRPRTSIALAGKHHKSVKKFRLEDRGPGSVRIDDTKGFVGDLDLVSHTPGRRLYYVTGDWRYAPGITVRGRMALVVEYKEKLNGGGKATDAKMRGYMAVDNTAAGAALKMLAKLFPDKVDKRVERFMKSIRNVVASVDEDPDKALRRLEKSSYVPERERIEFRERFLY